MDLPYGDEKTVQFITNVGLVTSRGPHGDNVMAAEWTHLVSYKPGLIAVCIGHDKATVQNIRATKEFGVSIASEGQNVFASVAGNNSGKDTDKVLALKELGFKFSKGKKTGVLLVQGGALVAECKVVHEVTLGDHVMFVGEVQDATVPGSKPLAYHRGKYWELGKEIPKPPQEELDRVKDVVEKHKKK